MMMVFHVNWPLFTHYNSPKLLYRMDSQMDFFFHIFSELAFNFIVLGSHVKHYCCYYPFLLFVIFHGFIIVMGLVVNLLLYEYFMHCSSVYVKLLHYFCNFVLC
jgi:hypothetical protein